MSEIRNENTNLDLEFTNEPVPMEHRKSIYTVSGAWFGYTTSITNTVFGGMIVGYLGIKMGALAIFIGALLLLGYIGLLGYHSGETGMNFPLQAKKVFGNKGYTIVIAFMATIGIGWFAFQTGLTGHTLFASFGINELLMTVVAGIFFIILVLIGIKAISIIGWFAAPMFILLSIVAITFAVQEHSFTEILNYTPEIQPTIDVFSFGVAVSIVFGAFSDAGTMTADITRWAKNGRQSFWAVFTAFPIGDFIGYMVGGLIVATGIIANPTVEGGNFMLFLTGENFFLSILLFLFVFVNLGASCSHCLYNGAITWSNITKTKMVKMIFLIGIIGTIIAIAGIWDLFPYWLNLLGIMIPPAGVIMILDLFIFRKQQSEKAVDWRLAPFITWGIASVISFFIYLVIPHFSYAIVGVISAIVIYSLIALMSNKKTTVS